MQTNDIYTENVFEKNPLGLWNLNGSVNHIKNPDAMIANKEKKMFLFVEISVPE